MKKNINKLLATTLIVTSLTPSFIYAQSNKSLEDYIRKDISIETIKGTKKDNIGDKKVAENTEFKINYAYVIDKGLILNLPDKATLADTPLYWRYSYEKDFKPIDKDFGYGFNYNKNKEETGDFSKLFNKYEFNKYERLDKNDYRIDVEVPSKVQVVIIDKEGKQKPYEFVINEDNFIFKDYKAPDYVDKLIKNFRYGDIYNGNSITNDRYMKKDLLIVRRNATLNLYDSFKGLFTSTWDSFNTRELEFKVGDSIIRDPFSVKFNKAGSYKISVSKEDSNKTVDFTILVLDKMDNKKYDIQDKIEVSKNHFTGYDFFKDRDKADINRFYIQDGKDYYLLDHEFNFDKTKEVKLTLVDIKDNRKFNVKANKVGLKEIPMATAQYMFNDIDKHWAKDRIIKLVSKGVIAGYEDNTFRPDNNMTKREAIAFIGRLANSLDQNYVRPTIRQNIDFNKGTWGNEEVDFVLGRVPANLINEGNLDEKITREEVALLLEKTFLFKETNKSLTFKDKEDIKFANSVEKLVAFGSIKGYPDNTFKAKGYITRAEFISMLFTLPNVNY